MRLDEIVSGEVKPCARLDLGQGRALCEVCLEQEAASLSKLKQEVRSLSKLGLKRGVNGTRLDGIMFHHEGDEWQTR